MSQYTTQELLSKWATEEITAEMAIGQLIQAVKRLEREIEELKQAQKSPPKESGKFVTNGK